MLLLLVNLWGPMAPGTWWTGHEHLLEGLGLPGSREHLLPSSSALPGWGEDVW